MVQPEPLGQDSGMRPLVVTLGSRIVTAVPRLVVAVAGAAWDVGDAVLHRVRGRSDVAPPEPPPRVTLAPEVTVQEAAPEHGALPLEDFDHLTVGALRSRIRSLDVGQVRQLHAYEVEHANRLQVVTILANRIVALEKEPAESRT